MTAIGDLPQPALLRGLGQLVEAGLASRQGTPPEASYTFKHALVRDTAYGMLLRSRRRELHARAAAALEDQSPELREQQPELLAHHYSQAGLVEPAVIYWATAGRRSVARSAMIEAVAQLARAIELVPALPEGPSRVRQELELQGTLGGALFALQAWGGRAVQAYTRALELAEELGDVEAIHPACRPSHLSHRTMSVPRRTRNRGETVGDCRAYERIYRAAHRPSLHGGMSALDRRVWRRSGPF